MTATYLQITGLDPIVARDGRPFGDGTGNRMRGLPWPLPSAVAGSARRAFVIQQESVGFDPETIADDRQGVRGSIIGRIERHGGQARIRSAAGTGTEVEIRMPR